jgi:hypothetical protein
MKIYVWINLWYHRQVTNDTDYLWLKANEMQIRNQIRSILLWRKHTDIHKKFYSGYTGLYFGWFMLPHF